MQTNALPPLSEASPPAPDAPRKPSLRWGRGRWGLTRWNGGALAAAGLDANAAREVSK